MIMKGKVWKFGDDISTDLIAPGRLFHLRSNLPELAKHVMEDARPGFAGMMSKGDFIVAGDNFGLGSSREHAPTIIRMAGISAVLAKSFARIFYRNCINIGLPALICDTSGMDEGDELEVDIEKGIVKNLTKGDELMVAPFPTVMLAILKEGGLLSYVEKRGDLTID
ncbi:MAG: 3-isopropylmalate dehydratase small subunit [Candidatus Hydrothermarchaeaceae archaeon]